MTKFNKLSYKFLIRTFLVLFPSFVMAQSQPLTPPAPHPLMQDLNFIYQQIIDNHPGVYYNGDPNFKNKADQAYQIAEQAFKNLSSDDLKNFDRGAEIIEQFVASFKDVHVAIGWYHKLRDQQSTKRPVEKILLNLHQPKIAWINLPTFVLNKDQEKDLQAIFDQESAIKSRQVIVIDVRRNSGGNSAYGRQLIYMLFGRDYVNQKLAVYYQPLFVDWRASLGNFNHMKDTLMKNYTPQNRASIDAFLASFQQVLDRGEPYFRQKEPATNVPPVTLPSPVLPPIVVIIDQSNISSTLIFIDELKAITDKVILVGRESGADTVYGEIRRVQLPSERGIFAFPIKIFGGRQRGNNESYKPDYVVDPGDNLAIEQFVRQNFTK